MTKLDFDHTNAGFIFLSFWFYYFFFFCLSQFSDDFPIILPSFLTKILDPHRYCERAYENLI